MCGIRKVNMRSRLFRHLGPKTRMSQGVVCIDMSPAGELIAGAGDGTIALIHADSLKVYQPPSAMR